MKRYERYFVIYISFLTIMLSNWMWGKFSVERPNIFRVSFIVISLIGIIFILDLFINKKLKFKVFPLLIIIFNVYILLICLISKNSFLEYFKGTLWLNSLFIGYYFSLELDDSFLINNRNFISFLTLILFGFFLINVYRNRDFDIVSNLIEGSYIIYFSILLYAYCCVEKNDRYEKILTLLIIFCGIISYKRTTILLLIFSIPLFYLAKAHNRKIDKSSINYKNLFKYLILILILFFIVNYLSGNVIISRFSSSFSSKGNGRFSIWLNALKVFNNSSILEKFLGHGFDSVINIKISGSYGGHAAHNDFIEVLFDYGIIGLLGYLFIVFYIIYNTIKLRNLNFKYFPVMAYILPIWFFMSFFSDLILWPMHTLTFMFFAGFMIAKIDLKKIELESK